MQSGKLIGMAAAASLFALAAAPAWGHAGFPANQNFRGAAANPLPAGSAQHIVLRVPEERAGPPKLDNVDVKVDLPAGWTDPVCGEARTADGASPGDRAAGWSCAVEPGEPTVLHWQRAADSTALGIYFPFTVTTGEAGSHTFAVHQTYSSGEVVDWSDKPTPPDCTSGTNTAGTACARPAPTRAVGDAAGKGYWLVASDGGIFAFGDAAFYGSTGAIKLNQPVVGMAPTPTGKGYWLVASDGGIFAFGDAAFFGSTGAIKLNQPITGMAATPLARGYWLVAADGGIFAFGDAAFFGSKGAAAGSPAVALAATPSGQGYWILNPNGEASAFGNAAPYPAVGGGSPLASSVAMALTPSGKGYWIASAAGQVQAFGDATGLGSTPSVNQPVVGMASLR